MQEYGRRRSNLSLVKLPLFIMETTTFFSKRFWGKIFEQEPFLHGGEKMHVKRFDGLHTAELALTIARAI